VWCETFRNTASFKLHSVVSPAKLIFFLLLLIATQSPAMAYTCNGVPEEECEALFALYESTNGDQWYDNSNWFSENQVWSWYGITGSAGHVQGINLRYNGLNGTIPADLEKLDRLRILALGSNSLTGPIPPELANLSSLLNLSLGANNLTGEIPPELASLSNLTSLNLSSNQLTGEIPQELGNMDSLEWLSLQENKLSGAIPPELGNLTRLTRLNITYNNLTGSIPVELTKLTGLDDLDLFRNKLTGEIPPELGNMTWLRSLNLSFNHLSGPIPPELGNMTNLGSFFLNSNNFSGELPDFLGTSPSPYGWINLSWNRLYTSDPAILQVMKTMEEKFSSPFVSTQTLPPKSIKSVTLEDSGSLENRVEVSWKPITYVDDPGGYQVYYQKEGGSKFHFGGMTPDKESTSLVVSNLEPNSDYTFRVNAVTWNHGWNGNILYSEDSVTTSAETGSLNRAFIPVWKQSPEYFTGVVVSNFGDTDFDLKLTAYGPTGGLEPLKQNPAAFTVRAGLQESRLGREFFGEDFSRDDFSWIELDVENSNKMGSIFLFGVNDTRMLDGAEAQYKYAKKLYFTRPLDENIFQGWETDIQMCIVNPTDEEVQIVCWMKGSSREFGKSYIIPPRGFVKGNARELIPNYYDVTNGYIEIEVTEGPGVIGFSRIEFPGIRTALGMNAVEAHQSEKMYSAQLAHGANIVTNLQLLNTNARLRNVKLTPVADDGTKLASSKWVAIPGGKTYNADLGTLFGLDSGDGVITGSLVIESFGRGVIGDIVFAEGQTMEYAMSLPLQTELFQEAVFNHISSLPTVFTGFAFFNPGEEIAEVIIEAFDPDGDTVAEKTLSLGPGERIARILTDHDIWPGFKDQSGGYIRIQSTAPIAGQQLFGDRDLRYMAAVPPTTRAEAMFNN
jgi:fibronectin type III domain protein/Leucine Rich Repeat (LRR) protein